MENLVSFTVLVAVLVNRSGVPEQLLTRNALSHSRWIHPQELTR